MSRCQIASREYIDTSHFCRSLIFTSLLTRSGPVFIYLSIFFIISCPGVRLRPEEYLNTSSFSCISSPKTLLSFRSFLCATLRTRSGHVFHRLLFHVPVSDCIPRNTETYRIFALHLFSPDQDIYIFYSSLIFSCLGCSDRVPGEGFNTSPFPSP